MRLRILYLRGLMIAVLALSVSSNIAFAGPFEDGVAAVERNDYATAVRLWRPLAEQNNVRAQYFLGLAYYEGVGVAQDFKKRRIGLG